MHFTQDQTTTAHNTACRKATTHVPGCIVTCDTTSLRHTDPISHLKLLLQTKLEDLEKEVIQMNSNGSTLQRTFAEFSELALVLEKAGAFFEKAKRAAGRGAFESSSETQDAPLLESVSHHVACQDITTVCFWAGCV